MLPKERMKIPRQSMPEQDPKVRAHNFREVPYGYPEDVAVEEAKRCLSCKKPTCIQGCPVAVKIPEFLNLIEERKFAAAARKIKETNSLPAICGRVCPQETQCEQQCVVGKKGEPVAIGRLERFAADYERENRLIEFPQKAPPTGKKVAIVGSGPAGLTAAGDLILLGHEVTVFEALHVPGGVAVYGIPEFRLPKHILEAEVGYLKKLGVEVKVDFVVGLTVTLDELLREFDAIFIGTGAGLPKWMKVPGENLNGVFSANEFLTRVNLMKAYRFPEADTPVHVGRNVAVTGGGNVAMDSARTALRLGADNVYIAYRRSRKEMPAREEEIHHAEEEGVQMNYLIAPLRILDDGNGWVRGMECIRTELGEPDASGRRRPIPIKGSEFVFEVDTVIPAIGNDPNPLIPQSNPEMKTERWGTIIADAKTGKTSKERVWAGGDIVRGAATVILAMGDGKVAATSIHDYLTNGSSW